YLALDAQRQEQQGWQRQQPCPAASAPALLPDKVPLTLVLSVLVAWIRSPEASAEQLARTLRREGLTLSVPQAQQVADHFGLEKKEGRCRSPKSCRPSSRPARSSCTGWGHCRRTPFTPSISRPSRPAPARCCRRCSGRGGAAWSACTLAPSAAAR